MCYCNNNNGCQLRKCCNMCSVVNCQLWKNLFTCQCRKNKRFSLEFSKPRIIKCRCKINTMAQNLQKKPSKGILKTSRSVDGQDTAVSGTPSTSKRSKEQRFDEMNIMETFHPANKDYGHMKVDEPKTPFSESVDGDLEPTDELDANILAAKLAASKNKPPKCLEAESSACASDEDMEEPEEERRKRIEFEKKRKMHYNEFQALQLARQLMAQEEEEEEDEGDENQPQKT